MTGGCTWGDVGKKITIFNISFESEQIICQQNHPHHFFLNTPYSSKTRFNLFSCSL